MSDKNFLSAEEVAARFKVSIETLNRWVDHDKFPCSFNDRTPVFDEQEINTWMNSHLENAQQRLMASTVNSVPRSGLSMFDLVSRGGIAYNIEGELPAQVIANAMALMHIPDSCCREDAIEQMQEREKVISTAIGSGIAVPHARNPILQDEDEERVGIFFLKKSVDFRALDREPVGVLFIMLSANRRSHLKMLQRIGYFCAQEAFVALLRRRAPREEIFEYLDSHRQIND